MLVGPDGLHTPKRPESGDDGRTTFGIVEKSRAMATAKSSWCNFDRLYVTATPSHPMSR